MKSSVRIRAARDTDFAALADALTSAFADDPVFEWMRPDAAIRARLLPRAFASQLRRDYANDGVVEVAEVDGAVGGGILWRIQPDRHHAFPSLRGLAPWLRLAGRRSIRYLHSLLTYADALPHGPFVYLDTIGIAPALRGRGIASALVTTCLSQADRGGFPVYLECSKTQNVPLYEHFGFQLRDRLDLPSGPPVWTMLRRPGRPRTAR